MNPWKYTTIILGIVIVFLALATFRLPGDGEVAQSPEQKTQSEKFSAPPPVVQPVSADDDPSLGPSDAKVTVIEFSDFQCPFCRQHYTKTLPEIKKAYIETGKIHYVYRDFPLSFHKDAQKAAEAAECADDQGKFWAFHDKIFDGQNKLGTGTVDIPLVDIKKYAKELSLDTKVFNECLDSGKYTAEVQKDFADGTSVGANATPTFFINGRILVGAQPFSEFQKIIDAELAR